MSTRFMQLFLDIFFKDNRIFNKLIIHPVNAVWNPVLLLVSDGSCMLLTGFVKKKEGAVPCLSSTPTANGRQRRHLLRQPATQPAPRL